MRRAPLYKAIAGTLLAYRNCQDSGNKEWEDKHKDSLEEFQGKYYPSGSGFDNGTKLDLDASTPNKLVFHTAFHHMTEHGCYAGWTEHTVTVTPDLFFSIDIKISGRNRNDIKEYMHDEFHTMLTQEIEY